ncbi:toxin HicA [Propionibacteriaceae bacterium Y1923]|uniref:toxin HicA n=1 Tax=Aestuariimicrobium sp. Y1814 TaxID=3418742 RepID=UPI003C147C25
MARREKLVDQMRSTPKGVRFADLAKVCDHYFGEPRQQGSSHRVYRMPWRGDPRVNIQDDRGEAKPYQVRQVLAAIDRLEGEGL